MRQLISDLKHRARRLHERALSGDAQAFEQVRALPDLRKLDLDLVPDAIQRRHALSAVARELGFSGWSHLTRVLHDRDLRDAGTLMHRESGGAYWNIWLASYIEASSIRAEHGGYLLGYKSQFFVVERHFIESIELDPDAPEWNAIGRDWCKPRDWGAWERITAQAVRARLGRGIAV